MLVAVAATLCSGNAMAQNVNLPEKGDFSMEVQFKPFKSDGNTFSMEGLKLRYFMSGKDALRLTLGFGIDSDKSSSEEGEGDYKTKNESTKKTGNFNIALGYERHFVTKGRLDFYGGAQIGFSKDFRSEEEITSFDKKKETNTWTNMTKDGERAKFGVDFSLFTGLDFYVYKGLFLGTELGLNVSSKKICEGEATIGGTTTKYEDKRTQVHADISVVPAIRLGWTF